MIMSRKLFPAALALVVALVVADGVYAQQRRVELTLDKAIEIALNDNPTIRVADLEIERYDYVRKQSESAMWPNLSGTASYSRAIVQQTMGGLKFGADNTFAGGLNLSLPLIAPGIWRNVSLTKEQMVGAVETARGSKINLVAAVKETFYQTLFVRQSIEVLEANEAHVAAVVNDIRKKYESGLVAEYDLIMAQVQLSNFRPQIIQAKNGLATSILMLKMYLNLPSEVELVPNGTLEELKGKAPLSGTELSTDVSQNSDLRMLEIQKNILQRQLRLANSQQMPMLAAFGQAQMIGMDRKPIDFGASIGGTLGKYLDPLYKNAGIPFPEPDPVLPPRYKYDWQHPVSVGVQLSIPIFAGHTTDWQARQVKNAIQQLDLSTIYATEGMQVAVKNAVNNMIAANEKMAANEKVVEQAKKGYSISKVRYDAGAGTMLELNNAESTMTTAQLNYNSSIYEFLSARAQYEKVTGKENN